MNLYGGGRVEGGEGDKKTDGQIAQIIIIKTRYLQLLNEFLYKTLLEISLAIAQNFTEFFLLAIYTTIGLIRFVGRQSKMNKILVNLG